jgi:hypothetical protein
VLTFEVILEVCPNASRFFAPTRMSWQNLPMGQAVPRLSTIFRIELATKQGGQARQLAEKVAICRAGRSLRAEISASSDFDPRETPRCARNDEKVIFQQTA